MHLEKAARLSLWLAPTLDCHKHPVFFIIICNTTYKNIQYTTLLTLLALLTTQYYITFSFPFTHTERERNENENKEKKTKKEGKKLLTTFVL